MLCTGDAGDGPPGSTHSYPDWAAFPAVLFIAYGRPKHDRSSPPLLTVLLLLTGEDHDEGEWFEKTRVQDLWEWETPRGLFLSLGKGIWGPFPA